MIACKSPGSSDPSSNTDPKSGDGQGGNNQSDEDPVNITETNFKILTGTAYETTVYKFVTDKEGPKIAIVGGIHGDEIAGWTAALRLVDSIKKEKGICGEIIIVPEANIVADKAKSRYGVSGYDLSDLNRSFPLGRFSSAKADTIKISDALIALISDFNPDYIIDLHESLHSWEVMEEGTKTSLGNTLIANNNSRFMRQLLRRYNSEYRLEDETEFRQEGANQLGSFNYYFTNTYPDKVVFTVETNRGYENGANTIDLEIRVRHQLNILKAMFDYAWNRIE
ncbi:MAG: succinylglutamate desuccinylase/aspartoacylase family protein [Bacilli bacterium]|nr:succinylglutamate desuccinylase/aspartoacylase family protein [Bacilli bacterium]